MVFYSSSSSTSSYSFFLLFLFTFVSFFRTHNNNKNNNNNNNKKRPRRNSLLNSFYCYIEIFICPRQEFFLFVGFREKKISSCSFHTFIFFRMFLMDICGSLCIFTIFGVHNFVVFEISLTR